MLIDTLLLWKQGYKLHWNCSFVLCPILLEQKIVMDSFILEMAIWEGGVSLLSALLLCCLRALKLWGSEQAAVLLSICIPQLLSLEYSGLILVLGNSTVDCPLYIQQYSLQQQLHIRTAFSGIRAVLTTRKELIWSVVKRKYVASIQGLEAVDLHLSEFLWMEKT